MKIINDHIIINNFRKHSNVAWKNEYTDIVKLLLTREDIKINRDDCKGYLICQWIR